MSIDFLLDEIEKAVRLIWADYNQLEKVRQRISAMKWWIEDRQAAIKYGPETKTTEDPTI